MALTWPSFCTKAPRHTNNTAGLLDGRMPCIVAATQSFYNDGAGCDTCIV
jgi:hypothetical protein